MIITRVERIVQRIRTEVRMICQAPRAMIPDIRTPWSESVVNHLKGLKGRLLIDLNNLLIYTHVDRHICIRQLIRRSTK